MLYVEHGSGPRSTPIYLVVSSVVNSAIGPDNCSISDQVLGWTGYLVGIELPRCIIVSVCVVSVITVSAWSSPSSLLLVLCISSLLGNST